jgi:hypothetical protein
MGYSMRPRRLEGCPNLAARLADWRRVAQKGVILYLMDGPCRPHHSPRSVADVRISKCTQNPVMSYEYVTQGRLRLVLCRPLPSL